jgi:hypothetical protein
MSRPFTDLPERMLAGDDATAFERRMLAAALENKPSTEASARMAKALGVTVTTTVATLTAAKALAAEAAAVKVTAAASATMWPWVSVGVLGLVVAGAVVGTRARHTAPRERPPASEIAAPVLAPPPSPAIEPASAATERALAPAASNRRGRAPAAIGALTDQTAFIDAARAAVSERADRRALEILRRYQEKYSAGLFRPEAAALKVEALMHLGRDGEARALAERFVAENRGTLLAARVAEIAGLTNP